MRVFGEAFDMIHSWMFSGRRVGAALSAVVFAYAAATAGAQEIKVKPTLGTQTPAPADAKTPAPTGPAPKIGAEEASHEFGQVWTGDKVNHTFLIRNTGDAVLKITQVKPSCGCTVAKQYDREIQPGATGKIPVTINTAKLKAKINKTITVKSNDTTTGDFRLTMTGTVKRRFEIDPARGASFGRIRPDEDLTRTLTLTNNMDKPSKLTLAAVKAGVFNAEIVEKEPGSVYELTISAKPPYAEKINRGNFKLQTDLPGKVGVDIAVSAYVPPLVEVTPPQVIIPKAQAKTRQQSVRVKFNSKEPHEILTATTNVPGAQVELKKIAESHYDVVLGLPANYAPPAAGHKLTLKTDDPKNAEVEVKITGRQTPKRQAPQRPAMQLSGKPVPDATFTLVDGKAVNTAEMKDDATLVMFYASWCGFCKRTLPTLNGYAKELEGKPVKIMAVSMDSLKEDGDTSKRARSRQSVIDQFKTLNVTLPQAFDNNKHGGSKFKVSSFPTMFLINKTGKIDRVYVGGAAATDGSLKKDIETLLSGKTLAAQKVDTTAPQKPRERPALKMAGKAAPAGTFMTAKDGSSVSLASSDTDATVAFFYASWCGYCKKSLPVLNEMSAKYASEGKSVRFVGVNQDTIVEQLDPKNRRAKTKADVMKQWADFGISFPQILDPNAVGRNDFKVSSFPTFFLIDKAGKIDKAYVGGTAINNGQLKKDIEAVLKGDSGKASAGK